MQMEQDKSQVEKDTRKPWVAPEFEVLDMDEALAGSAPATAELDIYS